MDYALAKELEDAGFPQMDCGNSKFIMPGDILWQIESDGPQCINSNQVWDEDNYKEEDCAYIPTLEELIEACGKAFTDLRLVDEHWIAMAKSGKHYPHMDWVDGNGATPTEAIAHLWLALKAGKLNRIMNDLERSI